MEEKIYKKQIEMLLHAVNEKLILKLNYQKIICEKQIRLIKVKLESAKNDIIIISEQLDALHELKSNINKLYDDVKLIRNDLCANINNNNNPINVQKYIEMINNLKNEISLIQNTKKY